MVEGIASVSGRSALTWGVFSLTVFFKGAEHG
jgi:hypothetical protein